MGLGQVFSLIFPLPPPPPQSRRGRTLCPGHSSEGFPVLSLGMATSSSTAQPERSAWHTSPKATSNGSTSKAVPSPRAPSCSPPAASSPPSTGTASSPLPQPCTSCVPGDSTPLPQLNTEGYHSLKLLLASVLQDAFRRRRQGNCLPSLELHSRTPDAQNPSCPSNHFSEPLTAWLPTVLASCCHSDLCSLYAACAAGR